MKNIIAIYGKVLRTAKVSNTINNLTFTINSQRRS